MFFSPIIFFSHDGFGKPELNSIERLTGDLILPRAGVIRQVAVGVISEIGAFLPATA
jgi:hypothetical protein